MSRSHSKPNYGVSSTPGGPLGGPLKDIVIWFEDTFFRIDRSFCIAVYGDLQTMTKVLMRTQKKAANKVEF